MGGYGRPQPINLAPGCWTKGIVAHEIGNFLLISLTRSLFYFTSFFNKRNQNYIPSKSKVYEILYTWIANKRLNIYGTLFFQLWIGYGIKCFEYLIIEIEEKKGVKKLIKQRKKHPWWKEKNNREGSGNFKIICVLAILFVIVVKSIDTWKKNPLLEKKTQTKKN